MEHRRRPPPDCALAAHAEALPLAPQGRRVPRRHRQTGIQLGGRPCCRHPEPAASLGPRLANLFTIPVDELWGLAHFVAVTRPGHQLSIAGLPREDVELALRELLQPLMGDR